MMNDADMLYPLIIAGAGNTKNLIFEETLSTKDA